MDKLQHTPWLRLTRLCQISLISHGLMMRRCGLAKGSPAAFPAMTKGVSKHISLASVANAKSELFLMAASGTVLLWRESEYHPYRLAKYGDASACKTNKSNSHLQTQPMIVIV